VLDALITRKLYKAPLGSGKHDITCPWVNEHTDAKDNGTAYFEPSEAYPNGGFRCMHSHGANLHLRDLLASLGIERPEEKPLPRINVHVGFIHETIDAAEKALATHGQHFQYGGMIASISTSTDAMESRIVPTSAPALSRILSEIAIWQKWAGIYL
jgi:hypothetical protein